MARETRFKRLDVRPLIAAGVEPLPRIRRTLQALKPDQGLVVVAPFLPSPLIEFLGGEGFKSRVEKGAGSEWVVYFWREAV